MAYEPPAAAFRVALPTVARAPRLTLLRRSRTALTLTGLAAVLLALLMQGGEVRAAPPIAAPAIAR